MPVSFINFQITFLPAYCKNLVFIKKGVPQTAQISKLESIFLNIS